MNRPSWPESTRLIHESMMRPERNLGCPSSPSPFCTGSSTKRPRVLVVLEDGLVPERPLY